MNLTFLPNQFRERTDRFLDRRLGINAVLLVQVDGFDTQSP